ncbi:hypothetical protein SAMN06298226_2512 [Nitrosovibrio sp. Nv4]|nr:hypothetical protein SAMN06298226_2512 [Nitrosovibrio sp. Nv4]
MLTAGGAPTPNCKHNYPVHGPEHQIVETSSPLSIIIMRVVDSRQYEGGCLMPEAALGLPQHRRYGLLNPDRIVALPSNR